MNIFKVYLIFFSFLLFSSCNKAEKKYNKEILKADSLFNSQNYSNARVHYYKAGLLNPDNAYIKRKIAEIDSVFVYKLKEVKYNETIKLADNLFGKQEYLKAKDAYEYARSLGIDSLYVITQIDEIEFLMDKSSELSHKPYHIIVGCFAQDNNAFRLQHKLVAANFDSRLIPRRNATLNAVTYTSHETIHEAYNNLKTAKNSQNKDSWILYYNFAVN